MACSQAMAARARRVDSTRCGFAAGARAAASWVQDPNDRDERGTRRSAQHKGCEPRGAGRGRAKCPKRLSERGVVQTSRRGVKTGAHPRAAVWTSDRHARRPRNDPACSERGGHERPCGACA
eukprot:3372958-Prymnesium_polylepis.1